MKTTLPTWEYCANRREPLTALEQFIFMFEPEGTAEIFRNLLKRVVEEASNDKN